MESLYADLLMENAENLRNMTHLFFLFDHLLYIEQATCIKTTGKLEVLVAREQGYLEYAVMEISEKSDAYTGILEGCEMNLRTSDINKLIYDNMMFRKQGKVTDFVGMLIVQECLYYLVTLENDGTTVFAMEHLPIHPEKINQYYCFDQISKSIQVNMSKIDCFEIKLIGVDANGKQNPFTWMNLETTGDILIYMSFSAPITYFKIPCIIVQLNTYTIKERCSEHEWMTFRERLSKQYKPSGWTVTATDLNQRIWRTCVNYKFIIENSPVLT